MHMCHRYLLIKVAVLPSMVQTKKERERTKNFSDAEIEVIFGGVKKKDFIFFCWFTKVYNLFSPFFNMWMTQEGC